MIKVSIVIPTLNEESYIGNLLDQLTSLDHDKVEIIVVDGGSVDATLRLVKKYGFIQLIQGVRGRALQMNQGANSATGEFLLFIHADSVLSKELLNALMDIEIDAASFKMLFKSNGSLFKFYSWFTRLNWTIFTYGDQGLWVSKSIFKKIGGFKEQPILEDLDIVSRLKKVVEFQKLPYPIYTSPRRFTAKGIFKQQLMNIFIVTAYFLGVSPHFLSRYYRY